MNLSSGERQQEVSGNALDRSAITGPRFLFAWLRVLYSINNYVYVIQNQRSSFCGWHFLLLSEGPGLEMADALLIRNDLYINKQQLKCKFTFKIKKDML